MGLGDIAGTLQLVGTLGGLYLLLLWAASVLWALRDIRTRTLDPVARSIGIAVVALMPLLGIALYLIVRPSMTLDEAYEHELEREAIRSELHVLAPCPTCRRPVERDFVVCPYCRTVVREECATCRKLLASDWRHCPYCGASRAVREREVLRPAGRAPAAPADDPRARADGSRRAGLGSAEIDDGPPPPRQRPARRINEE